MNDIVDKPSSRAIILGCALTIVALLGTAPVVMLLDSLYRRLFLGSAVLDCNLSAEKYLFLVCVTPAFSGFFSVIAFAISLAGALRSWKNLSRGNKIIAVVVILAALVVGILSLLSVAFWFFAFLCPG